MKPTASEIARIWAKNIALGLPAHGFNYEHRTVAEVESARPAPLAKGAAL